MSLSFALNEPLEENVFVTGMKNNLQTSLEGINNNVCLSIDKLQLLGQVLIQQYCCKK
jgi:hypothetical protein